MEPHRLPRGRSGEYLRDLDRFEAHIDRFHVEHDRTGLLFDPSDPESLCREVAALVADRDLRGRLAVNINRKWAADALFVGMAA